MQRTVTTLLLVAGSLVVVFGLYYANRDSPPVEPTTETPATQPAPNTPAPAVAETDTDTDASAQADAAEPPATVPVATPITTVDLGELIVIEPAPQPEPTIGSAERDNAGGYKLAAQFSPWNAGLISVDLADHSTDPLEHLAYRVQNKVPYTTASGVTQFYYPLGVFSVQVNDQTIRLTHKRWQVVSASQTAATFELTIGQPGEAGVDPTPVTKIIRTWRALPDRYDLLLEQKVVNLTAKPMRVRLAQFGPTDLVYYPGYMGDQRKVYFGYVRPDYPGHAFLADFGIAGGARGSVMDRNDAGNLWPTDDTAELDYRLSFAATTNRYFTAAVTPFEREPRAGMFIDPTWTIDNVFPYFNRIVVGPPSDRKMLLTMATVPFELPAAGERSLDVALYAGPKDPAVFDDGTLYQRVGLDRLVIYETPCCLSFNSVAVFLHWLLEVFQSVVQDWGIAIITLTIIVRLILHPITKKSQLNMMRFGKQMQKLQPEIQKLKDKYKDDSQKMNQEMMKLYREKGVNPAGMAMGCLPMFLQTPIWIALWAMLFFAIELRHTPAFFDVFHHIGQMMNINWRFLTDLSEPDHFISLPDKYHFSIPLLSSLMGEVRAFNLLPILMIFTYWAQQKFMTPTSDPATMTDQAKQQQKMMKIMMLSFPVLLFNAPSGLTLYMLASSISGIIDGKIVRAKLKKMEEAGEFDKPAKKKGPKPGGFMDRMHKAAEERQKMMQQGGAGGSKKRKGRR